MTKPKSKLLKIESNANFTQIQINNFYLNAYCDETETDKTNVIASNSDDITPEVLVPNDKLHILLSAITWLSNPNAYIVFRYYQGDNGKYYFYGITSEVFAIDY